MSSSRSTWATRAEDRPTVPAPVMRGRRRMPRRIRGQDVVRCDNLRSRMSPSRSTDTPAQVAHGPIQRLMVQHHHSHDLAGSRIRPRQTLPHGATKSPTQKGQEEGYRALRSRLYAELQASSDASLLWQHGNCLAHGERSQPHVPCRALTWLVLHHRSDSFHSSTTLTTHDVGRRAHTDQPRRCLPHLR